MYSASDALGSTSDLIVGVMASAEFSLAREKILEHRLLSDLAVLMLRQGVEMDVLRSEFDAQGHDVVLEALGVMRHVQLKATVEGGKASGVIINPRLSFKRSGCVVWMNYDRHTLDITSYRCLGGSPGSQLSSLGDRLARRARANAQGVKAQMPGHRVIAKGSFDRLANLEELADRLFGPVPGRDGAHAVDAGGR